jgi:sterol desaturase/sphingolipid hydroxylase (fatty acid hydroxylase superfamily)
VTTAGDLPWISAAIVTFTFSTLLVLETWRPLRRTISSKTRRMARNLAMGGVSPAVVTLLQTPVLAPFAGWTGQRRLGLLNLLAMPAWLRVAVGILLLDYTLWLWHRWNHLVPFLWRFHLVHYVDRDMDASTAFRFHFGEQTLSIGFRLLQVVVLGADVMTLWIFNGLLVVSILFHHSNIRLPLRLERSWS